jgi:hypothetical protein
LDCSARAAAVELIRVHDDYGEIALLRPDSIRLDSQHKRGYARLPRAFLGLMLRSRTSSAFTRVFDALWCGVSKHEAAPILRDGASRLLRMRAERLSP